MGNSSPTKNDTGLHIDKTKQKEPEKVKNTHSDYSANPHKHNDEQHKSKYRIKDETSDNHELLHNHLNETKLNNFTDISDTGMHKEEAKPQEPEKVTHALSGYIENPKKKRRSNVMSIPM
jgi:hypothetical protein